MKDQLIKYMKLSREVQALELIISEFAYSEFKKKFSSSTDFHKYSYSRFDVVDEDYVRICYTFNGVSNSFIIKAN